VDKLLLLDPLTFGLPQALAGRELRFAVIVTYFDHSLGDLGDIFTQGYQTKDAGGNKIYRTPLILPIKRLP